MFLQAASALHMDKRSRFLKEFASMLTDNMTVPEVRIAINRATSNVTTTTASYVSNVHVEKNLAQNNFVQSRGVDKVVSGD
jgi:hypothetical protein